jgi:diphthine synthase
MGELRFIGIGLFDEKDMSLKALEEAKECDVLFSEFYTSVHKGSKINRLENLLGKKVRQLEREDVEEGEVILNAANSNKTGFLVAGDPMTATTHIELRLRAEREGITTKLVHGASIITAAPGLLGLQSYKFGRSTSIPLRKKGYQPKSPYEVIRSNKELGVHTLVLLDIIKGEGRTMRADEALDYLLELEFKEKDNAITEKTLVCIVADSGSEQPYVRADYVENIMMERTEHRAQTLVIPGNLHFMEAEALIVLAGAPVGIREMSV